MKLYFYNFKTYKLNHKASNMVRLKENNLHLSRTREFQNNMFIIKSVFSYFMKLMSVCRVIANLFTVNFHYRLNGWLSLPSLISRNEYCIVNGFNERLKELPSSWVKYWKCVALSFNLVTHVYVGMANIAFAIL